MDQIDLEEDQKLYDRYVCLCERKKNHSHVMRQTLKNDCYQEFVVGKEKNGWYNYFVRTLWRIFGFFSLPFTFAPKTQRQNSSTVFVRRL